MAVAYDEGVVERGGDGAGGAAVVDDGGAALGEHAVQGGVAQQPIQRGAVEAGAVDAAGPGGGERLVAVEVEHQVEVGAVAAAAAGLLVVEEVPADVGEGVGPAGRSSPGGFAVGVGALREAQGGGEQFAAPGAEVGVEPPAAPEGAGQVQHLDGFGLGVAVRGGAVPPHRHRHRDVADRQVDQAGHHHRFVLREERHGVGVEVGGDGVDLAAR